MLKLKIGIFLLIEKLLRFCVHPHLRAHILKFLGATVGRNVRIYEITLINLNNGFRNLIIEDDVHIGTDCLIDLAGRVYLHKGATLSPQVTIITHSDPGSKHNSPLAKIYPPETGNVEIGEYTWLGAGVTVLKGVKIGCRSVVGAGSIVNKDIPPNVVAVGMPARVIRHLELPEGVE